ncbi:MAG: thioredoxin [Methylotenera sp.]|nr:MAG: thioredoxin [Methylotenera sp.]
MRLKKPMLAKNLFSWLITIFVLFSLNSTVYAADTLVRKNFTLKDTAGKKHTLSQYKGKWVIVNYWATWCPPCLEEVPDLVALYDSRKNKDLMLLGVVFDYKDTTEVAEYVDDMLMSYPIVLGDDDVVKQIGSAEVMPTTYIYNPRGVLVKTKRGLVTKAYLEDLISNHPKKP